MMTDTTVWPGKPYPLGASFNGQGNNFSLFSEVGERVELRLFDAHGQLTAIDLAEVAAYCCHGYLPGVGPGQRYGRRWGKVLDCGNGFIGEAGQGLEAGAVLAVGARSRQVFRRVKGDDA